MTRRAKLLLGFLTFLAAVWPAAAAARPAALACAADNGELNTTVVAVNQLRYPDEIHVAVIVRDAAGLVVGGLTADDFTVCEGDAPAGRPRVERTAQANRIAFVLDVSEKLSVDAVGRLSALTDTFFLQLFAEPGTPPLFEVVALVPTDAAAPALPAVAEGIVDFESMQRLLKGGIAAGERRPKGQTRLFDTIERAAELGAETIVIISDGVDPTATESRIAELREALEGKALLAIEDRAPSLSPTALQQLLSPEATAPQQHLFAAPSGDAGDAVVEQALSAAVSALRAAAHPSSYGLVYASAGPEDAQTVRLTTLVALPDGRSGSAEQTYARPTPHWDEGVTALLDGFDAKVAYPTITFALRPLNAAFRHPTGVVSASVALEVTGAQERADLLLSPMPHTAPQADESAAESVALVVDTAPDLAAATERAALVDDLRVAVQEIERISGVPSRWALFSGRSNPSVESFDWDHGRLLNQTLRSTSYLASDQGSLEVALERAVVAADRDGDAHRRPAHVVLFTAGPISSPALVNAMLLARQGAVSIHVVQTGEEGSDELKTLASTTRGLYLDARAGPDYEPLVAAFLESRPQFYTGTYLVGHPPDGQRDRDLTLTLGEAQEQLSVSLRVDGPSLVGWRWTMPLVIGAAIWALLTFVMLRIGEGRALRVGAGRLAGVDADGAEGPPGPDAQGGGAAAPTVDHFAADRERCLSELELQGRRLLALAVQRGVSPNRREV